jgi:HSP90 family molecular chaperone
MIINQEQSNAVVTGEIKNNRVGIDVDNINFITNLLTSNLYSFPIESFLRETVANAWDSQVEAGNVNTPILIKISSQNKSDITISIRDYGTGLSPERFDEIYRNIGSSTKRNSNEYIGALGKHNKN